MFRRFEIRIFFLIAFVSGNLFETQAQTNMAFYPVENQFNSSDFNPAFLSSENKFTFSIFPMGGANIGYNNQEVIRQLVTKFLSGINQDEEYKDVLISMVDRKSFNQDIESTLLYFTYRSNVGVFNFRIKENEFFSSSAQGSVSNFLVKTDIQSVAVGQIQYLPALILHYREYSIGYSLPENHNKLSGGIRAKIYFGKGAFSSDISGSIQHESDKYFLRTSGKGYISLPENQNTSGNGGVSSVADISGFNIKNYLLNSGNLGFGLDLGVKYKVNPKLTFSMSAIDLGKINWKNNLNSKNFDSEFSLSTSSIKSRFEGGVEIITKTRDDVSLTDSIKDSFQLTYEKSAFSTPLPVKVYTGLNYQINPSTKISIVNRFILLKNMNHHSLSVTGSFELNKRLSVTMGYAKIGNSYTNVPLAIFFKRDFGQIYMGTDNFLSFLLPSISEFSGLTFGTCFYLFRKRDIYGSPLDESPFHKPKKVKKTRRNGLILDEYPVLE